MVLPSFELLVCLEIPHGWALHTVWNISKLGLLGDTVSNKSDSDRIVIDVDVSIVVVVCHVPVVIEGLIDISIVIVLEDALTTWGFHNRMVQWLIFKLWSCDQALNIQGSAHLFSQEGSVVNQGVFEGSNVRRSFDVCNLVKIFKKHDKILYYL